MVLAASCARLGGHCGHWGLAPREHAVLHAQVRLIDEVYARDMAAGHGLGQSSETGIRNDAVRLVELLAEEGFTVTPITATEGTH